jgi:dTDP-4-dehydrorhamnose reductase
VSILDKEKILILGARGMLGRELAEVFAGLNPTLWDKKDLDITDKKSVFDKILKLNPDIIINAAAYTAVDDCEKNEELANKVNGEAVGYLMEALATAPRSSGTDGARRSLFIHYSTDYVFNGKNMEGCEEDDISQNPVNAYGASKLIGEKYIKSLSFKFRFSGFKFYIIRTSWLYGKGGNNFVDTIRELIKKRDQIKVVNDQYGKPTYAYDLAMSTRSLLGGNYAQGVYHMTNETDNEEIGITWYDFAKEIFLINKEIIGKNAEIVPCSSGEFPRPAKRPGYSALINTKLPKLRDWRKALREYLKSATTTRS